MPDLNDLNVSFDHPVGDGLAVSYVDVTTNGEASSEYKVPCIYHQKQESKFGQSFHCSYILVMISGRKISSDSIWR